MEIKKYIRKPFEVNAVQVTFENFEEVAEWCNGRVEMVPTKMLGTKMPVPVVKIQGHGADRTTEQSAVLGSWIVERRGSFRVHNTNQFEATFELAPA